MRAGVGYDSHRFDESRPLILGGVTIPDAPGLKGHSDGDAVAHAITDAILGAAALGDIGAMFPDTDPAGAGADSMAMLSVAVDRLGKHGFRVSNVDVTVIAERPRMSPHVTAIRMSVGLFVQDRPTGGEPKYSRYSRMIDPRRYVRLGDTGLEPVTSSL